MFLSSLDQSTTFIYLVDLMCLYKNANGVFVTLCVIVAVAAVQLSDDQFELLLSVRAWFGWEWVFLSSVWFWVGLCRTRNSLVKCLVHSACARVTVVCIQFKFILHWLCVCVHVHAGSTFKIILCN